MVNLREWATRQGIHPKTAYRWFRERTLSVPATKMGKLILVEDLESPTEVLTSFCARLYGKRSGKHRAEKALEAAASRDQTDAA